MRFLQLATQIMPSTSENQLEQEIVTTAAVCRHVDWLMCQVLYQAS